MGRRYTLLGENLTMGTGSVLAAIQPAAAGSAASWLEIERVEVTQNATVTSVQVRLALGSRNTSGTLTCTSSTPSPLTLGAPASGVTGGTSPLTAAKAGVASSADSGGTYIDVVYCNPNNQGGYVWQPIPEHIIVVPAALVFVARFVAAPGTLTGWTVVIWFHEVY